MVVELRRLTVQEYHRMAEAGIFHPTERIELLNGQIIKMAAKGTAHTAAISRTSELLRERLQNRILIRLQDPVQLDDYSEPEPDLAIVLPDPAFYEDHHPTPSEIFLIIEVADSSLRYDRELKAPTYGRSNILEYWVLDVNDRRLYVYRSPSTAGYQIEQTLSEEDTISPVAFPDCAIKVRELLRSN